VMERWTKSAKDAINAQNANSSSHRDPAFVTTYVMFVERCKRMENAVLKCGNQDFIHTTMEMIEKHTEKLESLNRGEGEGDVIFGVGPETGRSLGNSKRHRKRGGATGESSSQNANGKKKTGNA